MPAVTRPFTSHSSTSSSRSASPITPGNGRKSPYQPPPRSATTPLPARPPSTDITVSQDCAFPPFPTSKSRSATPTPPLDGRLPEPPTIPRVPDISGSQGGDEATMSRGIEGGNLLKRMDTIAPGPFDARGREDRWTGGHSKSKSRSSSQEIIHRSRSTSSGTRSHGPRVSTSSSNYTRTRSLSTTSRSSRNNWDTSDIPAVPSLPPAHESLPQKGLDVGNLQSSTKNTLEFPHLDTNDRSPTLPQVELPQQSEKQDPPPERPSIYSHRPKPSVVAAMQPLYSIGSTSSFQRSRSLRGRVQSSATKPVDVNSARPFERDEKRIEVVPPIPMSAQILTSGSSSVYNTPRESTSSNGTSSSGFRSGSSRSSPPLSDSPQRFMERPSDSTRIDKLLDEFDFDVDNGSRFEEAIRRDESPSGMERPMLRRSNTAPPAEQQSSPTLGMTPQPLPDISIMPGCVTQKATETDRPAHTRSIDPPLATQPSQPLVDLDRPLYPRPINPLLATQPPEPFPSVQEPSPTGRISPLSSPEDYHISPLAPLSNNLCLSPAPPPIPSTSTSPTRRPTTGNKGPCRGCNQLIIGKSVSSADGRLTGRYHKACFVCKTCQAPFQTADFYVTNNHPYCARHYHKLNRSLCGNCDRGIEGQYLETESMQKFHSYCLTCQECHRILREDYFEWNGRTLCEQHAFRASQQPSSLGPGRRFPERRTTRLMMMMM